MEPSSLTLEISGWLPTSEDITASADALPAKIDLCLGSKHLFELLDSIDGRYRTDLQVSAVRLATWFAANWWRLRWEPEKTGPNWRMAHCLGATGGGFVWPDIRFASEKDIISIVATPFDSRLTNVRFLAEWFGSVRGDDFEAAIDSFFQKVITRLDSGSGATNEFCDLLSELTEERRDPDLSRLRRLEAMAGFDAGEAPDWLVQDLRAAVDEVGEESLEELTAEEEAKTPAVLNELRGTVRDGGQCAGFGALRQIKDAADRLGRPPHLRPWQVAHKAARHLRHHLGWRHPAIRNDELCGLLDLPIPFLTGPDGGKGSRTVGWQVEDAGATGVRVALKSSYPANRRFALARLMGDFVAANGDDRLFPVTTRKTWRQQFQRAFAQEFLCPTDALLSMIAESPPDEEAISAAAERFQVSERLIETTLVNNGVIDRNHLAA